jgi:hypothetical protein
MNAAASAGREELMESSEFGLVFWIVVGAIAMTLVPVLVLSPFFGLVGSQVSRWSGLPPRIWCDDARVVAVDADGEGLLQALVYDGEEQLFSPAASNRRHWIRRWERGRGIVWEQRAELTRADVVRAVDGGVIYPTLDGQLRAVDARTGATRWERKLGLDRLQPTVELGTTLLIGGTDTTTKGDAWLQIDARDGSVVAEGRGDFDDAARELTDSKPVGPEPPLDDFDGWRRHLGSDARARSFLSTVVYDDESVPFIDNQTQAVKVPRPVGDRYDFDLVVERKAGKASFRYVAGIAGSDAGIESVHANGPLSVVLLKGVFRPGDGSQTITLIVDMARGRVIADLAESRTAILTPAGKLSSTRL